MHKIKDKIMKVDIKKNTTPLVEFKNTDMLVLARGNSKAEAVFVTCGDEDILVCIFSNNKDLAEEGQVYDTEDFDTVSFRGTLEISQ